ncbi:hypothetical protein D3C84_677670 [compost metagenome]
MSSGHATARNDSQQWIGFNELFIFVLRLLYDQVKLVHVDSPGDWNPYDNRHF